MFADNNMTGNVLSIHKRAGQRLLSYDRSLLGYNGAERVFTILHRFEETLRDETHWVGRNRLFERANTMLTARSPTNWDIVLRRLCAAYVYYEMTCILDSDVHGCKLAMKVSKST